VSGIVIEQSYAVSLCAQLPQRHRARRG